MAKNKVKTKALDAEVIEVIESIKRELRKIRKITDDPDSSESVICEEARIGAKKLLMARKIFKSTKSL